MNPKTAQIFVGMDISKGYADLHAVNPAGSVLAKERFDDTRKGIHLRLAGVEPPSRMSYNLPLI